MPSKNRFQSTLPHRERPKSPWRKMPRWKFQSTLPHRERPGRTTFHTTPSWISIHAPAQGATVLFQRHGAGTAISIHAPAQGATEVTRNISTERKYFNPRSRTGSDLAAGIRHRLCKHFNPRSRTGSDAHHPGRNGKKRSFQSTLPHRERPHLLNKKHPRFGFQSTLPHRERRVYHIKRPAE